MEKIEKDEDEKSVRPSEKQYADFAPAAVPAAPDGGIPMGYGLEAPAAAPTMESSMCAKGPCRHYWRLVTLADSGNPAGTWEALGIPEPRQHTHVCLVNPGMETDLGDDFVFECSRWDPIIPADLHQLEARRKKYLDAHPEPEEELDEPDAQG